MNKYFLILALALFLAGCGEVLPDETYKIKNVQAVLVHEKEKYSVLVGTNESAEIKPIDTHCFNPTSKFIFDVPPDKAGFVNVTLKNEEKNRKGYNYDSQYIEFHLHSKKEIEGAGWNHGKFGHGDTVIIED